MNTIENIKKTALIFFIILGLGHIITGLMAANNTFMPAASIINRILEIPFAITAIIYGFSNLRSHIQGENKKLDYALISITAILFVGLIATNILLPEKVII